jgi:hypothetical protein
LAAGYFEDGHYYSISPQNALEYGLVSEIDGSDRQQYHRPATFYFNLTVSKRLYDGAEFSLFVNNFFNERNFYFDRDGFYRSANPEIFYGIEFSSRMEPFAGYLKEKIFCGEWR